MLITTYDRTVLCTLCCFSMFKRVESQLVPQSILPSCSDNHVKNFQSRPFGVALLFAGYDEKGPQLFHLDPSGTFVKCQAKAIGSASEGAQTSLEEQYHKVKAF